MYGLSEKIMEKFRKIKEMYSLEICLFGSRARGDYKYNSDIDIAIINPKISSDKKYKIMDEFDKIDSEYKIDLVFIQDIKNEEFLNSIKKEGKKIWKD